MNSNLFWCIVGIIGGAIFSLVISLIFYLISRTKKRISYTVKTSCLISDKIKDIDFLDVKYNDNKINSLYISRVEITNTGNSIIEKSDFANSDQLSVRSLRFTISNSDFKNKTYINENNSVNWSFKLPTDNNLSKLMIDFDYIPKKGKISFCILHTDKIFVKGSLKDGVVKKTYFSKKEKIIFTSIAFISFIIGILFGYFFNLA